MIGRLILLYCNIEHIVPIRGTDRSIVIANVILWRRVGSARAVIGCSCLERRGGGVGERLELESGSLRSHHSNLSCLIGLWRIGSSVDCTCLRSPSSQHSLIHRCIRVDTEYLLLALVA